MPTMPFTDTDVVAAFSEMSVDIPNLGAGQQKVAYKANDGTGDVALKVLLHEERDSDDDEIAVDAERFRRELAGMAAISCPHVVQLLRGPELRLIADRSHLWYTEPYMAGGMLRAKLKTGAMAPREVHTLARSLLMAVEAMWNEGRFVHRDIKPENIGYLADGTIVLLDLGIALFSDLSALTESQMSGPGSQRYAAPEQVVLFGSTPLLASSAEECPKAESEGGGAGRAELGPADLVQAKAESGTAEVESWAG